MTKSSGNLNHEVSDFLDQQKHPFRNEIELLRNIILSEDIKLTENIKWNGPNYSYENEDRITMRIQPPASQIQLIFHRGAKKQEQPKNRLIASASKLLSWKENDRAVITFKSMKDIEDSRSELFDIISEWINSSR
ncbi:MAG TPA: DUF1801 domain-containing protein [Daejeonella sp.]|uniref:DUF1801 domain-containing protein n=1 Tax=Daejeonella sp. TaxID=2805397 RepID=UPI002EDB7C3C